MARLIKRSDKPGAPWFADFMVTMPNGRSKRRIVSTKTPDKATAKQILAKLQSDAAVRAFGIVDPLAEKIATESARTVESHLVNFRAKLHAAGRTEKYIDQTIGYVKEFAAAADCSTVGAFSADAANRWASSLQQKGLSARTIEARLTALKSFTKWLVQGEKLLRDPMLSVRKPNAQADRRLRRRMLLTEEWAWLMLALGNADDFRGTPAAERMLVYRLAVQTGLRAGEVRSLGRGSFHLGINRPYVRVVSGETKNRKIANQNIDSTLAADLRVHLATKLPGAPAFNLPTAWAMATMLREDMQAARGLWLRSTKDPDERAQREQSMFLMATNEAGEELDFHALRHTCGAWLAIRGVQPKIIQSVMRHSTITLTLDTYGHLIEGAEAAAVHSNADLTAVPAILAATGTDGTPTETTRFKCASFSDAWSLREVAETCEQAESGNDGRETKKGVFSDRKNTPFADDCGTLRDGATSAPARARTLDPLIKSQFVTSGIVNGNGRFEVCASHALHYENGCDEIDELLELFTLMDHKGQDELLRVARELGGADR